VRKIIIFFLFLISIPILILAFLGFIPGLSDLFGATKPKDLGISYTQQDYSQAHKKTDIDRKVISDDYQREFFLSPQNHFVDDTLTSAEVSAWINERAWKHYPFSNLQIRFNPDNTVEASGNVDIKKFINYIQVLGGMTDKEAQQVSSYMPLSGSPAFYLNFTGNVQNDQVEIRFSKAKLGNLPISSGIVASYTHKLVEFIEEKVLNHPSVNFNELRPDNGLLKVIGTLPDTESVK